MTLRRTTKLRPFSEKRLRELAEAGVTYPTSTFKPKAKMATVKAQRRTGPKKSASDLVKERSGGICEFPHCKKPGENIHHRRPRRMGGSRAADINDPSNLMHLCAADHEWIERNRAMAIVKGFLLYANQVPSQVFVWTRHSDQPVYLSGDGRWIPFEELCA